MRTLLRVSIYTPFSVGKWIETESVQLTAIEAETDHQSRDRRRSMISLESGPVPINVTGTFSSASTS